jgi:hypothetical protein
MPAIPTTSETIASGDNVCAVRAEVGGTMGVERVVLSIVGVVAKVALAIGDVSILHVWTAYLGRSSPYLEDACLLYGAERMVGMCAG